MPIVTKTNTWAEQPVIYQRLPIDPGPTYVVLRAEGTPNTLSVVKTGSTVPDFRKKIRFRQSAGSDYTVASTTLKRQEGNAVYRYMRFSNPGNFQPFVWVAVEASLRGTSITPQWPGNDAVLSQQVVNRCTIDFLNRAKSTLTRFQGGQFFGELRDAIHGIRHPFQSLRNLFTNHLGRLKKRRRSVRSVKQAEKVLKDTWLETQFHLLPIMSDARQAAEALAENVNNFRRESVIVSARAQDTKNSVLSTQTNATFSIYNWRWITSESHTYRCKITGCVLAEVANPKLFDAGLWGFKPRDFVPTLWEILPWSWAIDYAANVGNVLSALSFPQVQLAWSSQTVTRDRRRVLSPQPLLWPDEIAVKDRLSISGTPDAIQVQSFDLSRSHDLYFIPSFGLNLEKLGSIRRLINLGAALTASRELVPFFKP